MNQFTISLSYSKTFIKQEMFTVEKATGEFITEVEKSLTYGYVKVTSNDGSGKYCVVPKKMADQYLTKIKEMEIFEDDLWIVTFPKCGTTWTQEMLWMLNNDLDYERSKNELLWDRFPFIEDGGVIIEMTIDTFEICKNIPRPRHIKTHLPAFLMPDQMWTVKPKIVYTARNPKDAAVSFYHHFRHIHSYSGTKDGFLKAFVNDQLIYTPFNDHVLEFWKIRDEPNILFLFYEDMKRNLDQEVKKAMKFLNKNYSQEEIDKLCDHLSFESMKENPSCNAEKLVKYLKENRMTDDQVKKEDFCFIRKGQVGSHEGELTAEINEILDKIMNDAELVKCGFAYKF